MQEGKETDEKVQSRGDELGDAKPKRKIDEELDLVLQQLWKTVAQSNKPDKITSNDLARESKSKHASGESSKEPTSQLSSNLAFLCKRKVPNRNNSHGSDQSSLDLASWKPPIPGLPRDSKSSSSRRSHDIGVLSDHDSVSSHSSSPRPLQIHIDKMLASPRTPKDQVNRKTLVERNGLGKLEKQIKAIRDLENDLSPGSPSISSRSRDRTHLPPSGRSSLVATGSDSTSSRSNRSSSVSGRPASHSVSESSKTRSRSRDNARVSSQGSFKGRALVVAAGGDSMSSRSSRSSSMSGRRTSHSVSEPSIPQSRDSSRVSPQASLKDHHSSSCVSVSSQKWNASSESLAQSKTPGLSSEQQRSRRKHGSTSNSRRCKVSSAASSSQGRSSSQPRSAGITSSTTKSSSQSQHSSTLDLNGSESKLLSHSSHSGRRRGERRSSQDPSGLQPRKRSSSITRIKSSSRKDPPAFYTPQPSQKPTMTPEMLVSMIKAVPLDTPY